MQSLRNSHGFGRLLVGWLLLWFVAMAAAPLPLPAAAEAVHEDCESHAHDSTAADAHSGHGTGATAHCPLCLNAGAPPQAAPAHPSRGDAPRLQVLARDSVVVRVRSAAPPPGRGPPAFS